MMSSIVASPVISLNAIPLSMHVLIDMVAVPIVLRIGIDYFSSKFDTIQPIKNDPKIRIPLTIHRPVGFPPWPSDQNLCGSLASFIYFWSRIPITIGYCSHNEVTVVSLKVTTGYSPLEQGV